MNQNIIHIKNYPEFRNGFKNLWGKITDEEFDSAHGDLSRLVTLVSEKYLIETEEIQDRIEKLLASFDNESDQGLSPDKASFEREPNSMETQHFGAHSGYRRGLPDYNDGSEMSHYGGNDDFRRPKQLNEVQDKKFGKVAEGNRGSL